MEIFRSERGLTIRLDRGEEVLQTLTQVVRQEGLAGGSLSGIGAVEHTTLGYYDLATKEYLKHDFPEDSELVALTGNISWVDGEPFIHAHAIISGKDFVPRSGHLFCATIAVTGEIFLVPSETRIVREPDERTGLKLMGNKS